MPPDSALNSNNNTDRALNFTKTTVYPSSSLARVHNGEDKEELKQNDDFHHDSETNAGFKLPAISATKPGSITVIDY